MNGNFSRTTYTGGPAPPYSSPQSAPMSNGFVFTGHGGRHCFGGRRMGPCGGTRSFHTGRGGSYGRYQQPPRQQPQMAPSPPPVPKDFVPPHMNHTNNYHANPQGFINGIKKIVNGFINPKLNCDFYSDHNRFYNPKYRNNYMMDRRSAPVAMNENNCNPGVGTVFLGMEHPASSVANGHHMAHSSTQQSQPSYPQPAPSATFEFTIFTSDDFPALPEVKKQVLPVLTPAVTTVSNKLPRRRRKARDARSPKKFATPPTDSTCEDFVVLSKPKINKDSTPVANVLCQSPVNVAAFPWRCRPRVRQISECSDDSFVICFSEEAPEGVLEVTRDSDSDDESDFSESSSEDDDTIDETDNLLKVPDIEHLDSGFEEKKDKKVRFNLKPEVHVMYKWDYAYRAARRGEWEKYARDRDRFKKRIGRLAIVINPALDTQHRENIYRTRFCESDKNDASINDNDQQNSTRNNSNPRSNEEFKINNITAKVYHA